MTEQDFVVKTGIKTVLDEEIGRDHGVPGSDAGVEQPSLLPLRQLDVAGTAENTASPGTGEGRGPGRPKGARNRNTEEWRNFLLSRYSSPLIALAETYSRPIRELAIELGYVDKSTGKCTAKPEQLLELFKVQLQCAKELAPYVHQKQPMAIDGGENGLMQLIINTGTATREEAVDAGVMDLNFIEIKNDENQKVSETEKQNSVVSDSVAFAKGAENQGATGQNRSDSVSERHGDSALHKGGV